MPIYSLVPADEEARKAPPRPRVFAPDEMMKQPRSKTTLFESDEGLKNTSDLGVSLNCITCNKTYKNKKSLADHRRRYHSKLPLRLYTNRYDEKSQSESENDDDKDSTRFEDKVSRKRKSSRDHEHIPNKKRMASYSDDSELESSDSENSESRKRIKNNNKKPQVSQDSRPHISHPPRKRSISPDTERVIKKLKRKHKEESIKRKLRKNLEKRKRDKRKRLRRKVVTPKYIKPLSTDDEVDNINDLDATEINDDVDPTEDKKADENINEVDENEDENDDKNPTSETDDDSNSDENDDDISSHVNCVSIEDFEKVRKAIKNYSADTVINDVSGLHVIKTLFNGILQGWIPLCTSQKQMFSKNAVAFMRKTQKSKIIDLHSLIRKNKGELENIFNFVDKSIKLVVESYNKFGIADEDGNPK